MWPARITTRAPSARRAVSRALGDRRGNVAMLFGLAALPLMGAIGLAVDGGRAYLVQNRMAKALDAAGLAAARVALSERADEDAQRYFDANFPEGYLGATDVVVGYSTDANVDFVTLQAQTTVPTVVMALFGFDTLTVAETAVIERLNRGLELALVMDNTGSMRGSKITGMKAAATDLVNILFGEDETLEALWISVVPYTATVNIGAGRTGWLKPSDRVLTSVVDFGTTTWKGCVEARALGGDELDDPPATDPFESFFYPDSVDNDWILSDGSYAIDERNSASSGFYGENNGRGPNLGCGPAITSLTNVKQTVIDAIDEMLPWHRGGTTSNLGMVWGWRTISPRWQGLWGGPTPATMPLDYGTPLMDKAVILLTDGENQFYDWDKHYEERAEADCASPARWYAPGLCRLSGSGPDSSDYTAYGRLSDLGYPNLGAGKTELDSRLGRMCAAMKAENILIYTITFGSAPGSATQALYRDCATEPANYFHAPDNATLSSAFRSIGQRLSNLRVVE